MLESIRTPSDIKKMTLPQLEALAVELRDVIITTVSENGGHLGSNLGLVEATIMLHRLFDIPNDTLIFDVGHQCYAHKLLTGRYERFSTLRKKDGISGFPNRFESEYDTLTSGHSGASVSAALGVASANALSGNDRFAIAVVGDGSFTNGMVYEALNNCNNKNIRLIILLNDNEMSISSNVGSMANYLSKIRTSGRYYRFKRRFQKVFGRIPVVGNATINLCRHAKNGLRRAFYKQPFFEPLGVRYFGPVDGNDLERLGIVIAEAKKYESCALIHIKTQKGKGYAFAESTPEKYHSVSRFDVVTGITDDAPARDFSAAFGDEMIGFASADERVCAITAAMCAGTGLKGFAARYPRRFFDVGIAEEHEITFAAGLAVKGMLPVCAVYATFAQRVYDQLIHDVALQKLHIVLAIDRAGFVPGDGETHQGIFDVPMLSAIPGVEIYAPADYDELHTALDRAMCSDTLSVVRYPKGTEALYEKDAFTDCGDYAVRMPAAPPDVLFVTYGAEIRQVIDAAAALAEDGIPAGIVKLQKIYPLSLRTTDAILRHADGTRLIFFAEEGSASGGIAEKLAAELAARGIGIPVKTRAVEGVFPRHATVEELKKQFGLDAVGLSSEVRTLLGR